MDIMGYISYTGTKRINWSYLAQLSHLECWLRLIEDEAQLRVGEGSCVVNIKGESPHTKEIVGKEGKKLCRPPLAAC